jgi:hypothetical protein
MTENKYASHVVPVPIEKIPHDGYSWEGIYAHKGETQAPLTISFQYITDTFEEGPPHTHDAHQLLMFVGTNLEKMSDFDAEIEIALGDELEVQRITSPSIVSIPPGLQHCPLRFTRIGKPVLFFEFVLQDAYGRVKDGAPTLEVYTKFI